MTGQKPIQHEVRYRQPVVCQTSIPRVVLTPLAAVTPSVQRSPVGRMVPVDILAFSDIRGSYHGQCLTFPTTLHSEHQHVDSPPLSNIGPIPMASIMTTKPFHPLSFQSPNLGSESVYIYIKVRLTHTSSTTTHLFPSLLTRNSARVHVVGVFDASQILATIIAITAHTS